MAPIRVLIAHSQTLVADALTESLERSPEFFVLDERPTMGLDAVETALKTNPDVMLLDYWLPVLSGPMATMMILARSPDIRILSLSWLHSGTHIAEAIRAGAVGYLPMSLRLEKVREAIRRAYAGQTMVFEKELRGIVEDLERRDTMAERRKELVSALTARELRTLWLLSSGKQMREVAAVLDVTRGSLQMKLHTIFNKIGARSQIEAIAMVTQQGLIPPGYMD